MDARNERVREEKILAVDDMPANLAVLKHILSGSGFDPTFVTGGPEALASVALSRPDLILLDIVMPGMDGFELCEILKSRKDTRNIPILLISGLAETDAKIKGFGLGASDYITKPFDPPEVIARIETHLRIGRLEARLRRSESAMRSAERLARIGTWTKDPATGAVEWSDMMFELFGEDPAGRSSSISDIIARKVCKDDRAKAESILLGTEGSPPAAHVAEFRIAAPDGAERLVMAAMGPRIPETSGEDGRLIGSMQDITEIRHPGSTDSAVADRHSRILESLPTGFILMDSRFVLLEANTSFQHLAGHAKSALIGSRIGMLDLPDSATPLESTISQAFMSGAERVRACIRHEDGRGIPVELEVGSDDQSGSTVFVLVHELEDSSASRSARPGG